MTARHHALDLLAARLDRAANRVPYVLAHLDQQRANVPLLAAQDTTRPNGTHDISNPTLATILQLDPIARHNRRIDDTISAIETWVAMLELAIDHARRYRYGHTDTDLAHLEDNPHCMEPDCTQIPAPRTGRDGGTINDGRCLDCGQDADRIREQRQQRAWAERMRYRQNTSR